MQSEGCVILPPSPNWYGSHLAAWSASGVFYAYASHNSITVLQPRSSKILAVLSGHTHRVLAVEFLQGDLPWLVSAAADGCVRLWHAADGSCLRTFRKMPADINAFAVVGDGKHVAFGDGKGSIWHWPCDGGKPKKLTTTVNAPICCMASCSGLPNIVCVGTLSGSISLVGLDSQQMQSLQHHKGRVHSLSWASPSASHQTWPVAGQLRPLQGQANGTVQLSGWVDGEEAVVELRASVSAETAAPDGQPAAHSDGSIAVQANNTSTITAEQLSGSDADEAGPLPKVEPGSEQSTATAQLSIGTPTDQQAIDNQEAAPAADVEAPLIFRAVTTADSQEEPTGSGNHDDAGSSADGHRGVAGGSPSYLVSGGADGRYLVASIRCAAPSRAAAPGAQGFVATEALHEIKPPAAGVTAAQQRRQWLAGSWCPGPQASGRKSMWLLTSSSGGRMLAWKVPCHPGQTVPKALHLSGGHGKNIFCISCCADPALQADEDAQQQQQPADPQTIAQGDGDPAAASTDADGLHPASSSAQADITPAPDAMAGIVHPAIASSPEPPSALSPADSAPDPPVLQTQASSNHALASTEHSGQDFILSDAEQASSSVPSPPPSVSGSSASQPHSKKRQQQQQRASGLGRLRFATTSLDRSVCFWNVPGQGSDLVFKSAKVAWCLSGLGGHVYSLAAQHSLHSPPLIAAGCGDATIRLFKLSPPQDTHLSLLEPVGPLSQARPAAAEQPVHQGLQIAAEGAKLVWSSIPGMVTALQWHPQQQDVLAFGCDNGSVSLLELASQRVHSFSTRHKAPVTACCWMPLPSSSGRQSSHHLLTLCKAGTALCWSCDPSALFQPASRLPSAPIQPTPLLSLPSLQPLLAPAPNADSSSAVSAMAAASSCLAVALQGGQVRACAAESCADSSPASLHPLEMRDGAAAAVTALAWGERRLQLGRLATGCEDGALIWHCWRMPLPSKAGSHSAGARAPVPALRSSGQLQLPGGRVMAAAWSCCDAIHLAAACADLSIAVCHLVDGVLRQTRTFTGHSSPVCSLIGVGGSLEMLLSGSEDQTIRAWQLSDSAAHTSSAVEASAPAVDASCRSAESAPLHMQTERPPLDAPTRTDEAATLPAAPPPADAVLNATKGETAVTVQNSPSFAAADDCQQTVDILQSETAAEAGTSASAWQPAEGRAAQPESQHVGHAAGPGEPSRAAASKKGAKRQQQSILYGSSPLLPVPEPQTSAASQQAVQAACISLAQQLADGKSAQGLQYPDLAISADPLTASLMLQQMAEDASAGAGLQPAGAKQAAAHRRAALQLWGGDVGAALATVTQADALTADFVALAAGAGPRAWAAAARAYAHKLQMQGHVHMAALHLLAVRLPEEAVTAYMKAGLLREAATVASAQLLPGNSLLQQAHAAWGKSLADRGLHENAAAAFLVGGESAAAAAALQSRGTCEAQAAAAWLLDPNTSQPQLPATASKSPEASGTDTYSDSLPAPQPLASTVPARGLRYTAAQLAELQNTGQALRVLDKLPAVIIKRPGIALGAQPLQNHHSPGLTATSGSRRRSSHGYNTVEVTRPSQQTAQQALLGRQQTEQLMTDQHSRGNDLYDVHKPVQQYSKGQLLAARKAASPLANAKLPHQLVIGQSDPAGACLTRCYTSPQLLDVRSSADLTAQMNLPAAIHRHS